MELEVKKYDHLKTQADAVLHFLQNLDIEMVSDILEDGRTYQDFEKHIFIKKLDYAFYEFIKAGDTFLYRYSGVCNTTFCNFNCKGFTFIGNNSSQYFDLIIDIKDGVVLDIYECTAFKSDYGELTKNNRIEIDRNYIPF